MKSLKNFLLLAALMLTAIAEAKPIKSSHTYMFGFSASFKDSVVYITDIQDVQGAWIDSKTKFLLARDEYSRQLKSYLCDSLQQQDRVCLVIFQMTKRKAEKEYLKLMKKYKKGYELRYVNAKEFLFKPIDMSPDE